MIRRNTLVASIFLCLTAQAQNLNNVLFNPNPVHECEYVDVTLIGNYPSPNYTPLNYTFDPGTFTLEFFATGSGSAPQTAFNEAIPPLGPWTPGTYLFTAHLNLNGIIVDTWTTNLTVLAQTQHNPGMDTFADVCEAGPPVNLLTLMDGSPDPGGQWLDPFGVPHSATFVPGVDMAGAWLYQFLSPLPCYTDTSAQLFLGYLTNSDPGIDGTASICELSAPVDLFGYLFGTPDAGGTWTAPGGGSFTGIYDPVVDDPGIYVYTVPGIAPCPDPSATVTVTEGATNNAGVGSSAQICSDLTDVPLSNYLSGSPQQTGSWTDPFSFPFGPYASTFNAQEDFAGTYLYIVANGICPPDTAFVNISLIPNNNAGGSTTFNICVDGSPVDLFDELLGFPTPGGTWTGPGGPFTGTYDPAVNVPGAYVYTVDGLPPCLDASATVTIVEQPVSYAGVGGEASICILDAAAELYYFLTGGPATNGYWFTPAGDTLGTYTATISGTMNDPGVYTYVVNNAPCASDSAFVTVTILATPCTPGFLEMEPNVAHLNVAPNPSNGLISVEMELSRLSGEHALEVMNMNGQVLRREPVKFSGTAERRTLDLSSLPAGAYVMRLTGAGGRAMQRFMLY